MKTISAKTGWLLNVAVILGFVLAAISVQSTSAAGTISLTAFGTTYTQDFNTLASSGTSSTVPTGWDFVESGTNANTIYTAGTGSSNAGDTYSYGASGNSERAFGGLLSGSLNPTIGAQFTNNTGGTITSLAISYIGEMWRAGVANRNAADRLDFQLSTDATSLATGTWIDYDSLDFNSPNTTVPVAGALDGNATANRTNVSFTITGLNIANGSSFFIRWTDFNISSSDDGLSIDDFSLTSFGTVADLAPEVNNTTPGNGAEGISVDENIHVTFSEAVNVSDTWFTILCETSLAHSATVSGGPESFVLNPDSDFANGETCTVTVFASQITDQDAEDPPDNMGADFSFSFDTANAAVAAVLVINEIDYDQPGTDASEFVEIRNNDSVSVDLSYYNLVLVNGTGGGASIYQIINLPPVSLTPGDFFVVCGDNNTVVNCDLDVSPDTNLIQNGAPDAVGLRFGTTLIDAVSYEGNSGAPYTEGTGLGLEDDSSLTGAGISRCPDGSDTNQNNFDFSLHKITPGVANACLPAVVINEIDYDQPGTDTSEFIEIRNNDILSFDLSNFKLELVNGNAGGATLYSTILLNDVILVPGDYYIVCANAATVTNCDQDVSPDTNLIQNGAPDAVGLRYHATLLDAVSYEGNSGVPYIESSGVGLIDDGNYWDEGISRCPDGTDTNQNNVDFGLHTISPGAANNCAIDIPPTVDSTYPLNGATDVPTGSNIAINFSEDVTVSGSWFDLTCTTSGMHSATVSGGLQTYFLDPDANFMNGETCTVTIFAANVTDLDGRPNVMVADYAFSFTALEVCTLPYTPAYAIQGSGPAAAITGTVTTQGVVVGDYEGASPTLRGFYLQDVTGDGNVATSDGIFVFNGNNNHVNLGDVVRVTGIAGEFQDQTQISAASVVDCGTGFITPVDITLPVSSATYLEQYEGMLVRLPQTLYVTEHFQLGRFGQVVMSAGGRLQQPTNVVLPGAPALALQASNNLNRIIVDDALNNQNPDPILFGRGGLPLSASNTLRGGDTATNMVGVMTYTWSGDAASGNAYRLRPINALGGSVPDFQPANPRPTASPEVGGTVKVVGMNLLNYFNTFDGLPDNMDNCANGVGGAATDCRGADTQAEFDRQWPKSVAAILKMDPDVLGVNEIENDGYGPTSALQHLVDQLNAATAPGTYALIDVDANTGQINAMGTDAIKVALLYKPAVVTPIGQTAALNSVAFVNGGDSAARNRPTVAQAFEVNDTKAVFIVDVNHLKSKGSPCDAPDAGDGQGNCNVVRTKAATELMAWLATDPTGTGDPDILLIGDYNSYAKENPITVIKNAGFTNLIEAYLGPDAYSYVFDGQWGYLDNALGSASMLSQVTGVGDYHINADEPSVLDYNTDFKSPSQIVSLYAPDEFRISDHDPVIIGLTPDGNPLVTVAPASQTVQYSDLLADVTITGSDVSDDIPLSISTQWKVGDAAFVDGLPDWLTLSEPTCGASSCTWTLSGTALTAPGTYVVRVKVSDKDGGFSETDVTIEVTQEDARVTYTGALFASTASPTSSVAEVTLAATVQDISAVMADPSWDAYPGDIRYATVAFIDRDSSAVLCESAVGLVDPADLLTGTASCTWTVDLGGNDSLSTRVRIVVDGYYLRDSSYDDAIITVSKAVASQFITGGGYLILEDSAGQIAGDDGSKANFGFNVKYNKGGKNLQGKVTILVRRLEADGIVHVYQIKSNAITSLSVKVNEGTAVFNGKANITDVTDPLNPISIAGNAILQLTLDDNGEPGVDDMLGITVWKGNGGLWFANKWDGVQTVPQALDGGNLVVR